MTSSMAKALTEKCSRLNSTVAACKAIGDISLDEFLDLQAQKIIGNRQIPALKSPEDVVESALLLTSERLGYEASMEVAEVIKAGVIHTADHHGAIYNAQCFQGDILYYMLLKKLGVKGVHAPIASGGQVELGNVTFARGISVYTSNEGKQCLPFFRAVDHNKMAICARAIDWELLRRFRENYLAGALEKDVEKTLDEILNDIYEDEKVILSQNFSSQTTVIGHKISEKLFYWNDGCRMVFLEVEELVRPIIIKELQDKHSLIHKMINDRDARNKLTEKKDSDGFSLGSQLFACADDKGRKVFLALTKEGTLEGKTIDGQIMSFPADTESLCRYLQTREIIPGIFAAALVLFFERGITWTGGMFQAVYLPKLQSCFSEYLTDIGLIYQAKIIKSYDCTCYLCGPMFALYANGSSAMAAGPVEMLMSHPSAEDLAELVKKTTLWDSHIIGLQEMYPDLLTKKNRQPDWCQIITKENFEKYSENIINVK